jgi:hypothetical protein
VEQKWTDSHGEVRISVKTLVHQRGVDYIRKLLVTHGIRPIARVKTLSLFDEKAS